ncbi:TPA: DUF835 domain-containing protein [Pyrococcus horikoshii]|uniref:DUF835 domain-containing protein n=1 Tax=Pyrococcus horikoshii TaxID=53953 RepID=A0A832T132_PYRHR|nr:DUF835 domain-containing protein [Pyrococcus horikoshii]
MIYSAVILISLVYLLTFILIRINKYSDKAKKSAILVLLFLSLGAILKILEIADPSVKMDYIIQLVYSLTVFGAFVALSFYIKFLETPPSLTVHHSTKLPKNGGSEPKLVGAYLVSGSRSRIVDLINMIRELNAPILVFTRYPTFYQDLGENIKVIWITQASEDGIPPTKLHVIQDYAIKFAKENKYAVVIIDCVEYLLLYNEFASVFKFLASLKDYLIMMNSALVLAVDEKALDEKYYTLLLNEFEPL